MSRMSPWVRELLEIPLRILLWVLWFPFFLMQRVCEALGFAFGMLAAEIGEAGNNHETEQKRRLRAYRSRERLKESVVRDIERL